MDTINSIYLFLSNNIFTPDKLSLEFISVIRNNLDTLIFYIPLGIIGLWRWSIWLIKKIIGLFYRSNKGEYVTSVSVVTPVYNENPDVFNKALESWLYNQPEEIIAVVDYTDDKCIQIFKQYSKRYKGLKLIITHKPGKRAALADGILAANSDIVALVDSDTIWDRNVLVKSLPPFKDKKVAGVSTRQNVLNPETTAQKIFDVQLDLRYYDEFPFLAAAGDALVCLSGRTAFYRRKVVINMIDDLINETFMGKQVISGDDKRLTYLVLAAGWKVAYQMSARVYTPGMVNLSAYLKQRLRWTRNSLRADLRAIKDGWVFRHPALAFFQIDKVIQGFTTLLSPIFFLVALYTQEWFPAILILIWWFVSRFIKILPHLKNRPQDIIILPHFILYVFISAVMKIYALFTLNTQGWITRWDISRLPRLRFITSIPAYLATTSVVIILIGAIALSRQNSLMFNVLGYFDNQQNGIINQDNLTFTQETTIENNLQTNNASNITTTIYEVKPGDTIGSIAQKYNLTENELLQTNISQLPNWNRLKPGTKISIPSSLISYRNNKKYNFDKKYDTPLTVNYSPNTNNIVIEGRGNIINLSTIKNNLNDNLLENTGNKVWITRANIFVKNGVTLVLDKDEVEWLKLESNDNNYSNLITYNGNIIIDGVKITSWDSSKGDFDRVDNNGRSYITAKYSSQLNIYNSELAYLGFSPPPVQDASTWGVSWKLPVADLGKYFLTGEVINSKFHDNYFGAYTYGAKGIKWIGNEFYNNIQYGLDPHDESNGFLVENNRAYNNGNHGIIFSKRCVDNIIRNNYVFNNKINGIMLHEESNNNIIENNVIYDNSVGIAVFASKYNVIQNNIIYDNSKGLRINGFSNNNLIRYNQLDNNSQQGIHIYANASNNLVFNNQIKTSPIAVYITSNNNEFKDNVFDKNQIGIQLREYASGNIFSNNILTNIKYFAIQSTTKETAHNYFSGNHQITYDRWF